MYKGKSQSQIALMEEYKRLQDLLMPFTDRVPDMNKGGKTKSKGSLGGYGKGKENLKGNQGSSGNCLSRAPRKEGKGTQGPPTASTTDK